MSDSTEQPFPDDFPEASTDETRRWGEGGLPEESEWIDDESCDPVEVLASDFVARLRAGERPTIEEYAARHPEWSKRIRDTFAALLSVEQFKSREVRSSDGRAHAGGKQWTQLGDFRLVREIGRGGMGIVYEAEQQSLERHVAIKVLPPTALVDEASLSQFQNEARIIARLHHTHIVPIHGIGHAEGVHFLVMPKIAGHGLDQFIASDREVVEGAASSGAASSGLAGERLAARRVAGIGAQVADALEYAHQQQVLHRDIKPANILIDRDDHVWVADFGLAIQAQVAGAESRSLAGSLRYMAPERLAGRADVRSDVYSLGITLLELLVGRSIWPTRDPRELTEAIKRGEQRSLRGLGVDVPSDLSRILAKATAVDPESRYGSAGELRDDLVRFQTGYPIRAGRTLPLRRWWLWTRRNPVASISTACATLALVAATLASSWGWWANARASKVTSASLERERLERERSERTFQLAFAALNDVVDELSQQGSLADVALGSGVMDETGEESEEVVLTMMAVPTPQSAAVLQKLLPLYDQLSAEAPQRVDVLWRSIEASQRLGQLQANLGEVDDAAVAIERGLGMLDDVQRERGLSGDELEQLTLFRGRLLNDLGQVKQRQGLAGESSEAYQRAIVELETLPDHPHARLELARAHLSLATEPFRQAMMLRLVDIPRSRSERGGGGVNSGIAEHLQQAIDSLETLGDEPSLGFSDDLLLARCLRWKSLVGRRNQPAREEVHDRAVALLRELVGEYPQSLEVQLELSQALLDGLAPVGDLADAETRSEVLAGWEEADAITQRLYRLNPAVPAYALAACQSSHKLALGYRMGRQRFEARIKVDRALAIQRELIDRFPDNTPYLLVYLRVLRTYVELHRGTGDREELVELVTESLGRWERFQSQVDPATWERLDAMIRRSLNQINE